MQPKALTPWSTGCLARERTETSWSCHLCEGSFSLHGPRSRQKLTHRLDGRRERPLQICSFSARCTGGTCCLTDVAEASFPRLISLPLSDVHPDSETAAEQRCFLSLFRVNVDEDEERAFHTYIRQRVKKKVSSGEAWSGTELEREEDGVIDTPAFVTERSPPSYAACSRIHRFLWGHLLEYNLFMNSHESQNLGQWDLVRYDSTLISDSDSDGAKPRFAAASPALNPTLEDPELSFPTGDSRALISVRVSDIASYHKLGSIRCGPSLLLDRVVPPPLSCPVPKASALSSHPDWISSSSPLLHPIDISGSPSFFLRFFSLLPHHPSLPSDAALPLLLLLPLN